MIDVRKVQQRLKDLGFDPGKIDGLPGPKTDAAIVRFKVSKGLAPRPYLGPITLEHLFPGWGQAGALTDVPTMAMLPWMNEISKHMTLHEKKNFAALFAWLKSDGKTIGDPRVYPWCGDAVQTAIKLTLPNEPFPGNLGINPYLARNWQLFGRDDGPRFGAVAVFWRGTKTGVSGHVGFAIGRDPKLKRIRVRGGNQSDTISDAWLDEDRLLGYRVPKTWNGQLPALPIVDSKGAIISTNEA